MREKKTMGRRLISLILIFMLSFNALPSLAFAADDLLTIGQSVGEAQVDPTEREETIAPENTESNPEHQEGEEPGISEDESVTEGDDQETPEVLVPDALLSATLGQGSSVTVSLNGEGLAVYGDEGMRNLIDIEDNTITVTPGTYYYAKGDAKGSFLVTEATKEIDLVGVSFAQVWPIIDGAMPVKAAITLTHQDGREFTPSGAGKDSRFVVPKENGDSYYNWTFTPEDTDYRTQMGHIYVYGETTFGALNLSDSGGIDYVRENKVTVKAPLGMQVMTTSQLKFYMARDYHSYKPTRSDDTHDYYEMHAPVNTNATEVFMLQQGDKVIRYGYAEQVGRWNADKTELTLRALTDDPKQVHRDQAYFEANLMTNLPLNSHIKLASGEYFDLVPLRGWQAVSSTSGNQYQDPPYHYEVIGDSVEVEVTKDDQIGQFGRIKAVKPGVSVVVFSYDAMEWYATESGVKDAHGLCCYSALWPEMTGVAVVTVGDSGSADIATNIDLTEGKVVYFLRSQTSELGLLNPMNDHAEYTFTPTADGSIDGVRVHTPFMIEDGKLNQSPTDWLTDRSWASYDANDDGSYTVALAEGRNIVEVRAEDTVAYHVITARGIDATMANVYNPGHALAVGDTVRVDLKGLVSPLYKQGAIYNPQSNTLHYNANGVEIEQKLGQWTVSTEGNVTIRLTEEDEGTFTLSDGVITMAIFGELPTTHRKLARNSMQGTWGGGDEPENDLGKVAAVPDIAFEVLGNDDLAEMLDRRAGQLEGVAIEQGFTSPKPLSEIGTDYQPMRQNLRVGFAYPALVGKGISVGASPLYGECKLLVRYWSGSDTTKAIVKELEPSALTYVPDQYHPEILRPKMRMTKDVVPPNTITTTNPTLSVEVISIPQQGAPTTYSSYLFHQSKVKDVPLALDALTLSPGENSGAFGRFDGILEAADIQYIDNSGEIQTQDLGYGFIATEHEYTTEVPYAVKEIVYDHPKAPEQVEAVLSGDSTRYTKGTPIPLREGENTLQITYTTLQGNATTYTVVITRQTAPKTVNFTVPEGASLVVKQNGKTMAPTKPDTYQLSGGHYDYYVSKAGYLTTVGSFSVTTEDPEKSITVEPLEALPAQKGTIKVSVAAQDATLRSVTSIGISQSPEDLAAKRYVDYNHGGYTVLHGLLDAFAAGTNKISFTCAKGKLIPLADIDPTDLGEQAGWVCEVNGKVVDMATTLLQDGDVVRFYYNSDYPGMTQTWFVDDMLNVAQGEAATLSLVGTPVSNNGVAETAIVGADIYVGNEKVAITDGQGKVVLNQSILNAPGTYRVTAKKMGDNGKNNLTCALSTIYVKKGDGAGDAPDKNTVNFRLIGDAKHGEGADDHDGYVTWIATRPISITGKSTTVGEIFRQALDSAGLGYGGLSQNYITQITAPEAYGGYDLAEFDNGKYAGWMYTVNGGHPEFGLNDFKVTAGDSIVWHYVDDYRYEVSDWSEGSLGNTATWDKWLEAADQNPPNDGTIIDMNKQGEEKEEEKEIVNEDLTLKPEVTVDKNGEAKVVISDEMIQEALAQVAKDATGSTTLVIAPVITGEASKVSVALPKTALGHMVADGKLKLMVKTPAAELTLSNSGLAALSKAEGSNLTIATEVVKHAGNNAIKVAVMVDDQVIKTIADGLRVAVPFEGANTGSVLMLVDDAGHETILKKTIAVDGKLITVLDGSATIRAVDQSQHFDDVPDHYWGKDAIDFVTARALFQGTDEQTFDASANMTRAMLVTVLHRLEDETGGLAVSTFDDVPEGAWYADAVMWAKDKGIATGNGDGFDPEGQVTRESLVAMMYRYARVVGMDTTARGDLTQYNDKDEISGWAEESMKWAIGAGLLTGKSGLTIDPHGEATRAEVAAIMQRMVVLMVAE